MLAFEVLAKNKVIKHKIYWYLPRSEIPTKKKKNSLKKKIEHYVCVCKVNKRELESSHRKTIFKLILECPERGRRVSDRHAVSTNQSGREQYNQWQSSVEAGMSDPSPVFCGLGEKNA